MRRATWVLLVLGATGCVLERGGLGDTGRDAGRMDAAATDAGRDAAVPPGLDASTRDAGRDAGDVRDAGPPDAGSDAGPPLPPGWWDPAWGSRRRLTFDNGPHAEDLDDFPVLVVLDATRVDYALAGASGEALRFVDPDGTLLAHEIETWASDGTSYLWVRVPRIDASSTTDHVFMYYDQPSATDGQDVDATWAAPFRGVWHLQGGFADSSGHGNDGSSTAATDDTGVIGGAKRFAAGQHSTVPDAPSLDLTEAVTLSAWIHPTSLSNQLAVLSKREGCEGEANYALFVRGDDRLQFEHHDGGWRTYPRGTVRVNRWQWVVATFDTATDEVRIFIDGVQDGAPMANPNSLRVDANAIELARNGGCTADYMVGPMDEIRIEATARSPAWIAAQHRSMTDAYVTFGPREAIR